MKLSRYGWFWRLLSCCPEWTFAGQTLDNVKAKGFVQVGVNGDCSASGTG